MLNSKLLPQYIILIIFGILLAILIWPYITPIIMAIFFSSIFHPVSTFIQKKLRLGKTTSAIVTLVLTVILILAPLSLLLGLFAHEAIVFNQTFDKKAALDFYEKYSQLTVFGYEINLNEFQSNLQEMLQNASSYMVDIANVLLSRVTDFTFQFFIFLFFYFYGLRDGEQLVSKAKQLIPFSKQQNTKLFQEFKAVSRTVFLGNLLGGVISGIFAYIGFTIFQVKAPLIWALLATVLSLLPAIGTFFVYLVGSIVAGVFLNLYFGLGLFACFILMEVGLVQNVIRPKLLDDKIKVHPLLVFFSLAGGVQVFGSAGIIYGPLIVVIFMTIFEFILINKKA